MQVAVEELGGLERRLTVQVPAAQIDKEIQTRLADLSRRAKIDGFRPGKVPFKVVQRMYGLQVRQEVLSDLLQSSFEEAVAQQNLRPAGGPRIEPKSLGDDTGLEYTATFEVFPEFQVQGFEGLEVERPVAHVTETDIDAMLENLRKQRVSWNSVERAAQDGDRITVDFEGKLNGEDFAGNQAQDYALVLGSGRMIPGFEEALIGMSAGESKTFDVTFPADYHAENLAGQVVQFSASVKAVSEPVLPVIDDEFATAFGVEGGVDGLRKALSENMERELAQGVKALVKRQVMDKLLAANPIDLPKALIEAEVEQLAKQMRFPEAEQPSEETQNTKFALFAEEAGKRVALGLVVSRLISEQQIKLDPVRVMEHLQTVAASYEDADEVIRWYQQNPQAMDSVQGLVLEEQVVDWLLERAQVSDKPASFDEVMKPNQAA